ncbi:hypothetical protein PT2222_20353 [Paraburkholderia tropica]
MRIDCRFAQQLEEPVIARDDDEMPAVVESDQGDAWGMGVHGWVLFFETVRQDFTLQRCLIGAHAD